MLSFRNSLIKTGRPIPKPIYKIHNSTGLTLLNRLKLGLSYLNQLNHDKFNHDFRDCVNPLYTCSLQIESPSHFFLLCHYFTDIRKTLYNELLSVDENILKSFR